MPSNVDTLLNILILKYLVQIHNCDEKLVVLYYDAKS